MPICQGMGREEGKERGLLGPPVPRANAPLAEGRGARPLWASPLPPHGARTRRGEAFRGRWAAPPWSPGEPEPGLGEGDIGRGLFF